MSSKLKQTTALATRWSGFVPHSLPLFLIGFLPPACPGSTCMLVISCILAYVYVGILRSAERIGFSLLPWARTFVRAARAKNHGTNGCRPKTKNRISAMHPEMRYQQQMRLKEDRWSSPSADFHAATGKALTSGYRLFVSLYTTWIWALAPQEITR